MSRIVMKFGGTSVGSVERIKNVSNIVKNEFDKGNQIVVVLSAMAGETDRLIGLTKDISEEFNKTGLIQSSVKTRSFVKKIRSFLFFIAISII